MILILSSNEFRKRILVVNLLLILYMFSYCKTDMTDIHSSIYSLEKLLKDEIEFKQLLKTYISKETMSTENIIEKFFDSEENDNVSNFLNAFNLIDRTTHVLDNFNQHTKIRKNIKSKGELKFYNRVKNLINKFITKFPSLDDFHETCISMALIQETYMLNITDLIKGIIRVKDNSGRK